MPVDLSTLPVPPAGFGRCHECAYRESGTTGLCFTCAGISMQALAGRRCSICDRPLSDEEQEKCGNPLCQRDDWRYFDRNYSVAMRSGALEDAINRYKYEGRRTWAQIFARVLVGFLSDDEKREAFEQFDLIVASPNYIGAGSRRRFDHTRLVIQNAYTCCGGEWPFDVGHPPAIVKTAETTQMMGQSWQKRREIAETELRPALSVPDPSRTSGKRVLVYDDVFTDGRTLSEVARCLLLTGGANSVSGISLCRQRHRG